MRAGVVALAGQGPFKRGGGGGEAGGRHMCSREHLGSSQLGQVKDVPAVLQMQEPLYNNHLHSTELYGCFVPFLWPSQAMQVRPFLNFHY